MKKVLCYLGIFVLLGLALLPPILRIALPNVEETKETIVISSKILSCSNDVFLANTSYENEKVKMIILKKLFSKEEIERRKGLQEGLDDEEAQVLELETESLKSKELNDLFESIKEKSDILHNVLEDGEIVSIDFSVSEHKDLKIDDITQKMEEQQLYYENQELTCIIK